MHRGRGVGQQLIEHIVGWARRRGADSVMLWVTENNSRAIALYGRSGFKTTPETQPVPSHPELLERKMVLDLRAPYQNSNRGED